MNNESAEYQRHWPISFQLASWRTGLLTAALAIAALKPAIPLPFWILVFVFPIIYLVIELRLCDRLLRKRLLYVAIAVAVVHLFALLFRGSYTAAFPTLWRDDHLFFTQAAALARAWHAHFFPDITLKGQPPYMGTLHVGYQRALAALFYFTGPSTAAGLLLNVLCISLLPVFLGLTARVSFAVPNNLRTSLSTETVSKIALTAALIAACHPSQFYWSAFLLKDLFLSTIFVAALFMVCVSFIRRDPAALIGFIFCDYFLYSVRAYAAISLAIGAGAWLISHLPRRYTISVFIGFIVLTILLVNYTETGANQFSRLWSSIMFLAPSPKITVAQSVGQLFGSIPKFVLAPYAWIASPEKDPLYALYPGMWYLYLVVYPLAGAGFFWSVRNNFRIAMIPIMAFWCSAFILIMAVFAGNATRQRYYLEYVVMLFAAIGFFQPNRIISILIVILETIFAVGQVIILEGHTR